MAIRVLASLVLVSVASTAASGGMLQTSPVQLGVDDDPALVNCVVSSAVDRPIDVQVEVLQGPAVKHATTLSMVPYGSGFVQHGGFGFFHCRFRFPGHPSAIRASLQVAEPNGRPIAIEVAR